MAQVDIHAGRAIEMRVALEVVVATRENMILKVSEKKHKVIDIWVCHRKVPPQGALLKYRALCPTIVCYLTIYLIGTCDIFFLAK